MTMFQSVTLGVLQGVAEFFPVSSSGHLVIFQSLFGLGEGQLAFDIFVHLGTLVSILIVFAKDIALLFGKERKLLFLLAVASVPTGIAGFLFKDAVEDLFGMPKTAGCMLLVTGVWLIAATLYSRFAKNPAAGKRSAGVWSSLAIGIAQGVAIIPGISRSGATIATGILSGLKRDAAFKFSLLLSMPAIAGASAWKAKNIGLHLAASDAAVFLVGGIAAMITGIFAIKVLSRLVRNNQLYIFGIYCLIVGALVIMRFR